ncbi:MAG: transposase [Desulfobulbus sp.]
MEPQTERTSSHGTNLSIVRSAQWRNPSCAHRSQKIGKRELAAKHFHHLDEKDLVLLDRDYPAFWLFKLILFYKAHFCARISCKKWKIIRRFIQSGRREQVIMLDASSTFIAPCRKLQLDTRPIRLRLVRVELDSGETEVLITSLTDTEKFPHHLFAELYHDRWSVEEDYKVVKCRIEVEKFSGKSPLSVYQDFHAAVLSKNITAILVASAKEICQVHSVILIFMLRMRIHAIQCIFHKKLVFFL